LLLNAGREIFRPICLREGHETAWDVSVENTGFAMDADLGGRQPSRVKSFPNFSENFRKNGLSMGRLIAGNHLESDISVEWALAHRVHVCQTWFCVIRCRAGNVRGTIRLSNELLVCHEDAHGGIFVGDGSIWCERHDTTLVAMGDFVDYTVDAEVRGNAARLVGEPGWRFGPAGQGSNVLKAFALDTQDDPQNREFSCIKMFRGMGFAQATVKSCLPRTLIVEAGMSQSLPLGV